ncbi:protein rep [Salinicoccus sp. CNSTN-B1]
MSSFYHTFFKVLVKGKSLICASALCFTNTHFNHSKKRQYIKRDRWLELWQQSTKNPLITQVDIRRVKHTDNKKKSPKLPNTAPKTATISKTKPYLTHSITHFPANALLYIPASLKTPAHSMKPKHSTTIKT